MHLGPTTTNYLNALGLPVTVKPTLQLLQNIQSNHIALFSFNNLAVLLKQEIPLAIEVIAEKILRKKLGGYCFEQNKLAYHVLQNIGFKVELLLAKVVMNKDIEAPRTHRITLVTINEQRYLIDVGFGVQGPRHPILLELNTEQDQGDFCYRIVKYKNNDYCLQIKKPEGYFNLYHFDLGHYTNADCEIGHFYSHKHPNATFACNLVAGRRLYGEYYSLVNKELRHYQNGKETTTTIQTATQLNSILKEHFLLQPQASDVEKVFQGL